MLITSQYLCLQNVLPAVKYYVCSCPCSACLQLGAWCAILGSCFADHLHWCSHFLQSEVLFISAMNILQLAWWPTLAQSGSMMECSQVPHQDFFFDSWGCWGNGNGLNWYLPPTTQLPVMENHWCSLVYESQDLATFCTDRAILAIYVHGTPTSL